MMFAACVPASAEERPVDLALVLAADVSSSITPDEVKLQRQGYANALKSPRVLSAIRQGPYGRIAIAYVEWSGEGAATVGVNWTLIDGAAVIEGVAEKIESYVPGPIKSRRAGRTSISYGIRVSLSLLDRLPQPALRKVIDISGDGTNNDGEEVVVARDAAAEAGVTINGLAIGDDKMNGETIGDYYAREVAVGPGSFVERVREPQNFELALERKLWREIALRPGANPGTVSLAQLTRDEAKGSLLERQAKRPIGPVR
jgi:hypothetical protein